MGDRITIVIHLPVPVDKFNRVVAAVSASWPEAKLDVNHEEGWRIEVGPDE
jgi:hypothetical protein